MKVVVVDLDGTLLNVNTFHKWLLFIFKKLFFKNPLDAIKILTIILQRFLKMITHKQMKYRILKISEAPGYKQYRSEFVNSLDIYLNNTVLSLTKDKGTISILATAAPSIYAESIAKKYNFNHCLATPHILSSQWFENIRDKKRESLKQLLSFLNITKVDLVISDHHDDIPIMQMAQEVLLVNASLETEEILEKHLISYSTIPNIAS